MTNDELEKIRARDAAASEMWFRGPASFTAQAARDRRALLALVTPQHRTVSCGCWYVDGHHVVICPTHQQGT